MNRLRPLRCVAVALFATGLAATATSAGTSGASFVIEGEALVRGARASHGTVKLESMRDHGDAWSGHAQLRWRPFAADATLTLTLVAPAAGTWQIDAAWMRAPHAGDVRITLAGRTFDPVLEGFAERVDLAATTTLGRVDLVQGVNELVVRTVGRSASSHGFHFGLDRLVLSPVADEALEAPQPPSPSPAVEAREEAPDDLERLPSFEEAVGLPPRPIDPPADAPEGSDTAGASAAPVVAESAPVVASPPEAPCSDPAATKPSRGVVACAAEEAPSRAAPSPMAGPAPSIRANPPSGPTPADRRMLLEAAQGLDRWLADREGGDGWRGALKLDAVRAAMAATPPDDAVARALARRLLAMPRGAAYDALLAEAAFVRLARALSAFREPRDDAEDDWSAPADRED